MALRPDSASPLRIALIAGSLGVGGAEKQLCFMARALVGAGVDLRVYTLTRGEPYEAVLRNAGINVAWIGRYDSPALRVAAAARQCLGFRPHVVQATHFFANLYAALASRTCGALSVGAIRNDVADEFEANGRWSPWLLRSVDGLIVNSEAALKATSALGIAPDRVARVSNVIELEHEPLPEEALRSRDGVIIACVARLAAPKRIDRFLRALAAVRRTCPEVRGLVVGDGPERENLLKLAAGLGLFPGAVEFAGCRLDVPALLRAADVLVLTSDHEGLPNVLLEGMAAGLPVVTTAAGDAGRVVDNGVTGYVVPMDAEDILATRIAELAESPGLRRQLGVAGRAKVTRDYDAAELAPRLLAAYAGFARYAGRRDVSCLVDAAARSRPLPQVGQHTATRC